LGYETDKKLWRNTKLHAKYQFRLTNNYTRLDYTFLDVGADYEVSKWLSLSTAYVFNIKNDREQGWIPRHQWYANAVLEKKFGNLKISNREQVQTDLEDDIGIGGTWFYRNKTTFQYKLNKKITPYLYAEGYLRIGERPAAEDFLYRTRYMTGIKYKYNKHNDFNAGFMLQRQIKRKQPDYVYALIFTWSHSSR
jgi:hypothetical protein